MAPANNNAAKGLQQNRTRPTAASRPVVPAIPLSYGQKRQRQDAVARVKPVDEVQTPVAVAEGEPLSTNKQTSENEVNDDAGTSVEKTEEVNALVSPKQVKEEAVVEIAEIPPPTHQSEASTDIPEPTTSTTSATPSVSSKSAYQMPPPFVPANRAANHSPAPSPRHHLSNSVNAVDPANFPPPPQTYNGHNPVHHGHPSTSSLVFGAYPESNNSSPAPPLSAGHFPPPPFPQNGHHPHPSVHHAPHLSNGGFVNSNSNGFSPMAPPPGYYPHMNGPTDFRRPLVLHGPADGYSPDQAAHLSEVRTYDPPTPHSFQGSQSSVQAGENDNHQPAFNQYAVANGSNGHFEDGRAYAPPRVKRPISQVPVNFPTQVNGQPPHPADHLDGLVLYLQSQFHNPALSDCSIELRYTDDRERPQNIPGHRLILARSPMLKNIMSKHPQGGEYGQTLLVEAGSPFLRSDAFAMAVQRLYGWPLIDATVLSAINPRPGGQMPDANTPGSPEDRFGLGLGYATAGHILQIPPVVSRGLEIAGHHINWNTIEKALDFHLDASNNSHSQNGVGEGGSIPGTVLDLLHQPATTFLITAFPAAFTLDTTVENSSIKPRLPIVREARPVQHSHKLSFIQFGEYGGEGSDPVTSTLSKILLNLPFPTLKYVLESSRLGNVQGWATASSRQEIMYAVIEEREKRRLKLRSSNVPDVDRQRRAAEWDAVGWQESVQPMGTNESRPTLGRTWVGFTPDSP